MKTQSPWLTRRFFLATALLLLAGPMGCGRNEAPSPVEAALIPAVLRETFQSAKEPVTGLVTDLVDAVEAKDWPKASVAAQALSKTTTLTAKQRDMLARCLITINTQVTEAAATGNQEAEEVHRMIRLDK